MDKSYEKILHLSNFQIAIICILISVQTITVFSNIIVIIVMKRSKTSNDMSASKRPNLLMTTIAISGLLVIFDFFIPIFMLVPGLNQIHHNISMVLQSLVNYINALSLYVISFTMTFLSIDQYYSLTRVFNNPLDKISTNFLLKMIWLTSSILSLFFLVTNDVYYYEYRTHSIVCSHYENYLHKLSANKTFKATSTMTRLILQYIIPVLTIFVFSFRTVVHFLRKYFQRKETGFEMTIVFRLFLIFLIFIATNTAFHLTSIKQLIFNFTKKGQNSCSHTTQNWLQYYMFLLSCLIHPIIYFWFSRVFWKLVYTHILHRTTASRSSTVRTLRRDVSNM